MKKRAAFVSALMPLITTGQIYFNGTNVPLISAAAAILYFPELAKAETAEFYFNRANKAYKNGNYTDAIDDYIKAIVINPKFAYAYANRGVVKKIIGDREAACTDWREASKLGYKNLAKWVQKEC